MSYSAASRSKPIPPSQSYPKEITTSSRGVIAESRSDADLTARINAQLAERSIDAARQITVAVTAGVVRVRGQVQSAYEKQLVLHSVRRVAGVTKIADGIAIVAPPAPLPEPLLARLRHSLPTFHTPHWIGLSVLLAVPLLLAACSKSDGDAVSVYPAGGKVLFNGQPAAGALVVLHPAGTSLPADVRPTAQVKPDGTFAIGTYDVNDGAPAGEYTATVTWHKLVDAGGGPSPGPNVIPAKYGKPETSDLKVSISAGENNFSPFELKK